MNNNYNNIGESLAKQYKAALFIDNDERYINAMYETCNRGMTLIKVDETPNIQPSPHGSPLAEEYAYVVGRNNTYLLACQRADPKGDMIDPLAGIQVNHLPLIARWISETAQQTPRAMLFDWDRTITMVEGVHLNENGMHGLYLMLQNMGYNMAGIPDIYAEDALLYLCGGKKRLALLREIMIMCKNNNIDIIFVTNNGGCGNQYMNGLKELMTTLMPPGIEYEVVCSGLPPFNGHKGRAFRESMPGRSSLICLKMDGGRSHTTSKNKNRNKRKNKYKKQTRRNKSKSASRKAYK